MGHCTSLNTNVLIKTREESFKKRYFFITHKYYVPFYTHTMRERETEREREREITCCNPQWGQEELEL